MGDIAYEFLVEAEKAALIDLEASNDAVQLYKGKLERAEKVQSQAADYLNEVREELKEYE